MVTRRAATAHLSLGRANADPVGRSSLETGLGANPVPEDP